MLNQYLQSFSHALSETLISTREGEDLSLDEGMNRCLDCFFKVKEKNAKLIFIGNGASSSISSHFSADFLKNGGLRSLCFTDAALMSCLGNDLGFENCFAEPVARFSEAGDLLVAISSSGNSKNILKAAEVAKSKSCRVLTLTGFTRENQLRQMGDLNIYVPSPIGHYGTIESAHTLILHCLIDEFCKSVSERESDKPCI